jgi:hypothetical protein
MKIKSTLVAFVTALPLLANAGNAGGNGGDVVYKTEANGVVSIEMLDRYEGRKYGIPFDLGAPNLSVRAKVNLAYDRLARRDPLRADLHRARAESLIRDLELFDADVRAGRTNLEGRRGSSFFTYKNLPDIPDSGHLTFPKESKVKQIVIQLKPEFPEEPAYQINIPLLLQLDNDNRAMLVTHETSFRETLSFGANDSIGARYFNEHLCGPRLESMTDKEYFALLKQAADFRYASVASPNGPLWVSAEFENSYYPQSGKLAVAMSSGRIGRDHKPKDIPAETYTARAIQFSRFSSTPTGRIHFYEDQRVRKFSTDEDLSVPCASGGPQKISKYAPIYVYPNGELELSSRVEIVRKRRNYSDYFEIVRDFSAFTDTGTAKVLRLEDFWLRSQTHVDEVAYFSDLRINGKVPVAQYRVLESYTDTHSERLTKFPPYKNLADKICLTAGFDHASHIQRKQIGMGSGRIFYVASKELGFYTQNSAGELEEHERTNLREFGDTGELIEGVVCESRPYPVDFLAEFVNDDLLVRQYPEPSKKK